MIMRLIRTLALALALGALGALVTGCATTPGRMQKDLGYTVINSVEMRDHSLVLNMSGDFTSSYTVYKTSDPYKAVVELPGVWVGDTVGKLTGPYPGITEVSFMMTQTPLQITRIEILMETPMDVEPVRLGNSLFVNVAGPEQKDALMEARSGEAVEAAAPASGQPSMELMPAAEIRELTFSTTEKEVTFTVFGDGALEPDIFTLPNRIIIDVSSVSMKAMLPEKVYAPVKAVRFGSYDGKVRIVLDMEQDRDFQAATEDHAIVITIPVERYAALTKGPEKIAKTEAPPVTPAAPATSPEGAPLQPTEAVPQAPSAPQAPQAGMPPATEARTPLEQAAVAPVQAAPAAKGAYTGKPISLDFQDADIVPIFRFLGEIAGYNVVIHPNVSGKITLKLRDVPWDQALQIILELSNLDKAFSGNILTIAPSDIFVRQKEAQAQVKAANVKSAELVQETVHLLHISASEMKDRIVEAKLMSPRGTIRIDERTNTLILNDTEDNINKIRGEELKYWDTAEHGTMQVLIEAKVVTVRTDYTRTLGIRWGMTSTDQNFSWLPDGSSFDVSVNTPVSGAGADVGAPGGILSFGYADTFSLNLSLSALETIKKAKSLANPRVMTIDKQQASISKGTAIPYTTQAEGGGTKIETKSATLSLTVTPEIRPNGIVKLNVTVTNDSPTTVLGASAPGIDQQQITTNALVRDGETLVLGGIFTSSENEEEVRVPWLSQIPLLGWLFKTTYASKLPSELMIFITPKIIK